MALGHLDELQKAEKYNISWSLWTGFTVIHFTTDTFTVSQFLVDSCNLVPILSGFDSLALG